MTIDEHALAAVGAEWRTARQIYAVVDEGAFSTTRLALTRLAEAGKIERRYEPHPAGEISLYRQIADRASDTV